jgi:hypothetical protein
MVILVHFSVSVALTHENVCLAHNQTVSPRPQRNSCFVPAVELVELNREGVPRLSCGAEGVQGQLYRI